MKREQIDRRIKGSLAENEDYWYLCFDEENDHWFVEHEWDRVNPYKIGDGGNRGSKRYDVEEWIANKGNGWERIDEAREKIVSATK